MATLDERGALQLAVDDDTRQLVRRPAAVTLVDMPIGLFPSGRARARACDAAARRFLGPRAASVFNPPTRAMLRARTHAEVGPLGLTLQAFHLLEKVAALDRALSRALQVKVREAHPEVAFACLAGAPLAHSKRGPAGRAERLALLERAAPGARLAFDDFTARVPRRVAALDDAFDALVLAVAARDVDRGAALRLPPGEPPRDRRGLAMEILGAALRPARRPAPAAAPLDPRAERVYATVDDVPAGAVATYGQIAEEAGLPRRARFVGRCLGQLPAGRALPWWRVVNAAGRISPRGDGTGAREQRRRLAAEGVDVDGAGRIDLRRYRWRP